MMAILFGWRIRPLAIALGIVCGQALAIVLYLQQPDFGGINLGFISLALNLLVTAIVHCLPRAAHVKTA